MVQVINITQTSMRVTWETHGTNVAHYNIELYYGPDEFGDPVEGKQIYGISSGSRGYNFLGLASGRLYHVKLYSRNSSNQTIKVERVNFWTLSNNPVPGTPSLSVSVVNGRNLTISGYKGSDTDYIEIYINGSRQWNMYMGSDSYFNVSFSGSYSTTYTVMVQGRNSWNTGSSVSRTVTTQSSPPPDPPPAPSGLNMYASTETSASFAWNEAARADKYAMEIFRNDVRVDYDYNINGRTKTFTGLLPGVSYVVKLYGWNEGGNGTPISYHFSLGYTRPNNFGWSGVKERGRSYNLVNGRYTNLVSYDEFLAIRQRINDFRRYKSLTAYTFTNAGRGVVLTAALYNELNDAIADMAPPTSTPGRKSSGTANLPALLNGLVSALNSIK